jgi:glycosyltransferase involved in cell wall biosynthesis
LFFKYLENIFLKKVDLITIENSLGEKFVKQKFPQIEDKIMYLPVGVNDLYLIDNFKNDIKSFDQKENIFLTVGRIGEKIKNNEMMLRALSQINLKDWKMVFVGAINPEFQVFYNEWIKSFPDLKEKLIFIGEIKDRKVLYEWYNKSKVFCMTSWNESFCHSIGEALYFGNYIIGTKGIVSMYDLTDNEKYGITLNVDDDSAMAKKMQELIDNPNFLSNVFSNIVSYANQEFVWSKIVDKIYKRIENR